MSSWKLNNNAREQLMTYWDPQKKAQPQGLRKINLSMGHDKFKNQKKNISTAKICHCHYPIWFNLCYSFSNIERGSRLDIYEVVE